MNEKKNWEKGKGKGLETGNERVALCAGMMFHNPIWRASGSKYYCASNSIYISSAGQEDKKSRLRPETKLYQNWMLLHYSSGQTFFFF